MNHRGLSYGIVGLWANPLPGLPQLDQRVLVHLFNAPWTTQLALAPEGLVVQRLGEPPVPMVQVGPAKFTVRHNTIPETVRVLDAFMAEMHTRLGGQVPLLRSLGINSEHEWEKPTFHQAERWLGRKYIRGGLELLPDDAIVEGTDLRFRLTIWGRVYNVKLQPRAGNESAIFGSINDHRESWNASAPGGDAARRLIEESFTDIRDRLMPTILGGVAGA